MKLEEIKKEREPVKEEIARIELMSKEERIEELEKVLREKEIEQSYSKSIIDTPITWISRVGVAHLKNGSGLYVTISPYTRGDDPIRNPMNVEGTRSAHNITIVLPDTYVKYSGKVQVTLELLSEEENEEIE